MLTNPSPSGSDSSLIPDNNIESYVEAKHSPLLPDQDLNSASQDIETASPKQPNPDSDSPFLSNANNEPNTYIDSDVDVDPPSFSFSSDAPPSTKLVLPSKHLNDTPSQHPHSHTYTVLSSDQVKSPSSVSNASLSPARTNASSSASAPVPQLREPYNPSRRSSTSSTRSGQLSARSSSSTNHNHSNKQTPTARGGGGSSAATSPLYATTHGFLQTTNSSINGRMNGNNKPPRPTSSLRSPNKTKIVTLPAGQSNNMNGGGGPGGVGVNSSDGGGGTGGSGGVNESFSSDDNASVYSVQSAKSAQSDMLNTSAIERDRELRAQFEQAGVEASHGFLNHYSVGPGRKNSIANIHHGHIPPPVPVSRNHPAAIVEAEAAKRQQDQQRRQARRQQQQQQQQQQLQQLEQPGSASVISDTVSEAPSTTSSASVPHRSTAATIPFSYTTPNTGNSTISSLQSRPPFTTSTRAKPPLPKPSATRTVPVLAPSQPTNNSNSNTDSTPTATDPSQPPSAIDPQPSTPSSRRSSVAPSVNGSKPLKSKSVAGRPSPNKYAHIQSRISPLKPLQPRKDPEEERLEKEKRHKEKEAKLQKDVENLSAELEAKSELLENSTKAQTGWQKELYELKQLMAYYAIDKAFDRMQPKPTSEEDAPTAAKSAFDDADDDIITPTTQPKVAQQEKLQLHPQSRRTKPSPITGLHVSVEDTGQDQGTPIEAPHTAPRRAEATPVSSSARSVEVDEHDLSAYSSDSPTRATTTQAGSASSYAWNSTPPSPRKPNSAGLRTPGGSLISTVEDFPQSPIDTQPQSQPQRTPSSLMSPSPTPSFVEMKLASAMVTTPRMLRVDMQTVPTDESEPLTSSTTSMAARTPMSIAAASPASPSATHIVSVEEGFGGDDGDELDMQNQQSQPRQQQQQQQPQPRSHNYAQTQVLSPSHRQSSPSTQQRQQQQQQQQQQPKQQPHTYNTQVNNHTTNHNNHFFAPSSTVITANTTNPAEATSRPQQQQHQPQQTSQSQPTTPHAHAHAHSSSISTSHPPLLLPPLQVHAHDIPVSSAHPNQPHSAAPSPSPKYAGGQRYIFFSPSNASAVAATAAGRHDFSNTPSPSSASLAGTVVPTQHAQPYPHSHQQQQPSTNNNADSQRLEQLLLQERNALHERMNNDHSLIQHLQQEVERLKTEKPPQPQGFVPPFYHPALYSPHPSSQPARPPSHRVSKQPENFTFHDADEKHTELSTQPQLLQQQPKPSQQQSQPSPRGHAQPPPTQSSRELRQQLMAIRAKNSNNNRNIHDILQPPSPTIAASLLVSASKHGNEPDDLRQQPQQKPQQQPQQRPPAAQAQVIQPQPFYHSSESTGFQVPTPSRGGSKSASTVHMFTANDEHFDDDHMPIHVTTSSPPPPPRGSRPANRSRPPSPSSIPRQHHELELKRGDDSGSGSRQYHTGLSWTVSDEDRSVEPIRTDSKSNQQPKQSFPTHYTGGSGSMSASASASSSPALPLRSIPNPGSNPTANPAELTHSHHHLPSYPVSTPHRSSSQVQPQPLPQSQSMRHSYYESGLSSSSTPASPQAQVEAIPNRIRRATAPLPASLQPHTYDAPSTIDHYGAAPAPAPPVVSSSISVPSGASNRSFLDRLKANIQELHRMNEAVKNFHYLPHPEPIIQLSAQPTTRPQSRFTSTSTATTHPYAYQHPRPSHSFHSDSPPPTSLPPSARPGTPPVVVVEYENQHERGYPHHTHLHDTTPPRLPTTHGVSRHPSSSSSAHHSRSSTPQTARRLSFVSHFNTADGSGVGDKLVPVFKANPVSRHGRRVSVDSSPTNGGFVNTRFPLSLIPADSLPPSSTDSNINGSSAQTIYNTTINIIPSELSSSLPPTASMGSNIVPNVVFHIGNDKMSAANATAAASRKPIDWSSSMTSSIPLLVDQPSSTKPLFPHRRTRSDSFAPTFTAATSFPFSTTTTTAPQSSQQPTSSLLSHRLDASRPQPINSGSRVSVLTSTTPVTSTTSTTRHTRSASFTQLNTQPVSGSGSFPLSVSPPSSSHMLYKRPAASKQYQ